MKIYLLSRFNVYIRKFREMANLTDEDFEAWCDKRVALFERYTLPAVVQQSFPHFKWIIAFDSVVPPSVEALMERLKAHRNIVPLVVNNRPGQSKGLAAEVNDVIVRLHAGSGENILSIRLDTDDLVHRDFVGRMHTAGRSAENNGFVPSIINMPFGAQVAGGKLFAYIYCNNPFIGLIEAPSAKPTTAFGFAHHEGASHFKVRECPTEQPMWAQVIHDGNVANAVKPGLIELADSPALKTALSLSR